MSEPPTTGTKANPFHETVYGAIPPEGVTDADASQAPLQVTSVCVKLAFMLVGSFI